jgi:pimeloyl-ACP methyl ester carboxylesterase
MAFATIDGIATRYEVVGSGPPLLMYAPAGFDATLEKWTVQAAHARAKTLEHLSKHYSCIVFDRRECGRSGGRVERISWAHYVAHGKGLLDHLGIERAHLMGGCMGVCPVAVFGTLYPQQVMSMLLHWPVGGAKYRMMCRQRFAIHLAFVQERGLAEVTKLVASTGKSFGEDPRGGPWAAVLRNDPAFADAFAKLDLEPYKHAANGTGRLLFDRDTAPGAEPEDLMRLDIPVLIIPGRDASHATSAARYLEECLPRAEYWDVPPDAQTESNMPARMLEFLAKADAR